MSRVLRELLFIFVRRRESNRRTTSIGEMGLGNRFANSSYLQPYPFAARRIAYEKPHT
jgi:hypothetical protein